MKKFKPIQMIIITMLLIVFSFTNVSAAIKSGGFNSNTSTKSSTASKPSTSKASSSDFKSGSFSNTKPSTPIKTDSPVKTAPKINTPSKANTSISTSPKASTPSKTTVVNNYYGNSNGGQSDHFWSGFMIGHMFSDDDDKKTQVTVASNPSNSNSYMGAIIGTILVLGTLGGISWYLYKRYKR